MRYIIIYGIIVSFFAMATEIVALPFSSPLEVELNVDAAENVHSIERDTVAPALDFTTTSQSTVGSAAGRASYRFTNETEEAVFDITYDEMSLDPSDHLVRISGRIGFDIDEPVTYMVEGHFSDASESSSLRFLNQARLAPIGEPTPDGAADLGINGFIPADFNLNEIPEENATGESGLNFGSRSGTLSPGRYEFSYEALLQNMTASGHRVSGLGGVRLRLRAFAEPSAEPAEPNCALVPDNAFVLSHTLAIPIFGSPLDRATITFRHTIDRAATWQPAIFAVVAVPTTVEIEVDSLTDDTLDGVYTPINPTQIAIGAGPAIYGRGGVPGASEPIFVTIGGEDYFFFSNAVGALSRVPVAGANPAPSDFRPIRTNAFEQHHFGQEDGAGGRLVFNIVPGGGATAVQCTNGNDGSIPTCNGVPGTVVGTDFDDVLTGTSGDDVIIGRKGDDRINGGAGNDLICGDAGNDNIAGGAGGDDMSGGAGDDVLKGNDDDDILRGGRGNDDLRGNAGEDTLRGDAGDDTLSAGEGDDDLRGGAGQDRCKGGPGNDKAQSCESISSVP